MFRSPWKEHPLLGSFDDAAGVLAPGQVLSCVEPPRNLTFCSPLHLLLFMRTQLWFGLFVFAGVDYRVFVLCVEDEVAVLSRGSCKK